MCLLSLKPANKYINITDDYNKVWRCKYFDIAIIVIKKIYVVNYYIIITGVKEEFENNEYGNLNI